MRSKRIRSRCVRPCADRNPTDPGQERAVSEEFLKTLRPADSNAALDMLKRDSSLAWAVDDSGASALKIAPFHGLSEQSASIAQAKGELELFEFAAVGNADEVSRLPKRMGLAPPTDSRPST